MFKQYQLKNYNFRLIVLVLALSIMGILVIGSAKESSQIKQIIGLGLSLVVMVVASLVDYTWLLKLQWLMYAGSIAILAAVIFFGKEVNGSRRWFEIPHIGLTFQPAELVKIRIIRKSCSRKTGQCSSQWDWRRRFCFSCTSSRTFPRPSA